MFGCILWLDNYLGRLSKIENEAAYRKEAKICMAFPCALNSHYRMVSTRHKILFSNIELSHLREGSLSPVKIEPTYWLNVSEMGKIFSCVLGPDVYTFQVVRIIHPGQSLYSRAAYMSARLRRRSVHACLPPMRCPDAQRSRAFCRGAGMQSFLSWLFKNFRVDEEWKRRCNICHE